jgi:3-isopropylmalate/(R)-2-methylmalate dehydratase large subunit
MTLVEKILARHSGLKDVEPGQYVEAEVDLVMLSDVAVRSIEAFQELGTKKVYDPERIAIVFDHNVPARDVKTAEVLRLIKEFAKSQEIRHVFEQPWGGI